MFHQHTAFSRTLCPELTLCGAVPHAFREFAEVRNGWRLGTVCALWLFGLSVR